MQRIDENTFIDDTLVTCAEYQLFIDEISEQGKYYQPDHWTSDQFPEGQARRPILGVRSSDAVVFCEWLTQREDRQWLFRLPKTSEAQQNKLVHILSKSIGYWTTDPNHDPEFVWVDNLPSKPKDYDLRLTEVLDKRNANVMMDVFRSSKFYNMLAVDLSIASSFQAIIRLVDIDPYSAFDSNNKDDRAQAILLAQSISRLINSSIISLLTNALAVDRKHRSDIPQAFSLAQEFSYDLAFVLSSVKDNEISSMINRHLSATIKLIGDLLDLADRKVQKRPAVEGIRITKQRNDGATRV